MKSHELLREVFKATSPKMVAEDLGLSLSMIYKWAESSEGTGSGTANPLDRVAELIRSTGDQRIAHWVSQQAGGFHIANPEAHWPHPFYLVPATNRVVQEFADLLSVVAAAAADHHVTPDEAARIRARWEQLKSVTEGFVHACEEGNFQPLEPNQEGAKTSS